MSFVCLSPIHHDGKVLPVGCELPADLPDADARRLVRLGKAEERKAKPKAKTAVRDAE